MLPRTWHSSLWISAGQRRRAITSSTRFRRRVAGTSSAGALSTATRGRSATAAWARGSAPWRLAPRWQTSGSAATPGSCTSKSGCSDSARGHRCPSPTPGASPLPHGRAQLGGFGNALAIRPQARPDLNGWLAQATLTDRAPAPALGCYPDWSELPAGACSPSLRPPAGTGAGALFNVWLGPAQVHIRGRSAPRVLGAPATRARCGRDRGVELAPAPSLEAARLPARQW